MALNLPTADPATLFYQPMSNGRIVIVANADLAWSVAAAQRYARVKGIPFANVLAVPMGTSRLLWAPAGNAALRSALIAPLWTLYNAVLAQCVIMAPGCPQRVNIVGTTDLNTLQAAAIGVVPLEYLCKCAREAEDQMLAFGSAACLVAYIPAAIGQIPMVLPVYPAFVPFYFLHNGWISFRLGQVPNEAPLDPLYATVYEGLNLENIELPTDLSISLLGNAQCRSIPSGRLSASWTQYAFVQEGGEIPSQYHETELLGASLARASAEYSAARAPANRYRNPIHLQLSNNFTGLQTLAYLYSQLIGWGYTASYVWRSTPGAPASTYAPLAGAAYTVADLNAGRVRDLPYHLMVGDAQNTEMFNEPYRSAWKPTAGGGSYLGPSEGWQYDINGLFRGGSGGYSNALHVTTGIYLEMYSVVHNLLRGMTWAEAMYYPGQSNASYHIASGDPLARPFPR